MLDHINSVYFWDANFDELDIDVHADYIIRRVFELGNIEEIGWVHGWYGTERCQSALLSAEYLRETAIIQGMFFLDISEKSLFKCASKPQYHSI